MTRSFGLENGENVKVDFPQPKYEMFKVVNGSVNGSVNGRARMKLVIEYDHEEN